MPLKYIRKIKLLALASIGMLFGTSAFADYISVNKGAFQSLNFSSAMYDNIYYKYRNGSLTQLEFGWGNRELARIFGGVNLDSNNQVNNYSLGLLLDSDDKISYREFSIDDKLYYRASMFSSNPAIFMADVNAKTREFSYLSSGGYKFSYSRSNFPVPISVGVGLAREIRDFVDIKPDTQIFMLGEIILSEAYPAVRSMVEEGRSGWNIYSENELNLGVIHQKLSNQIYSEKYGNTPQGTQLVNFEALRGAEGTDIIVNVKFDMGFAYLFNAGDNTGALNFGLFFEETFVPSSFLSSNGAMMPKTKSGAPWALESRWFYGIRGGVAFTF